MDAYRVGYLVGSLARNSINRKLSRALTRLAPPELQLTEIPFADLPHYSYDYDAAYPPAAVAFKAALAARDHMLAGEFGPLVNYESLGKDALLSIPTPDHYLPLLYVLGCHRKGESIRFPVEGVDGGSISMLSVQIG